VEAWTGASAAALRLAMRMSVRDFAAHLGVAPRTVSYWEAKGAAVTPLPQTQDILDAALDTASPGATRRFADLTTQAAPQLHRLGASDLNDWAEDLDRAREAVARQHFDLAARLTDRWLAAPASGGDRAAELRALTLLSAGDLRRD